MTHKELMKQFTAKFPTISVKQWWKKGSNTVRVRTGDGSDLMFTYFSPAEWKLETAVIYEKSKDGI